MISDEESSTAGDALQRLQDSLKDLVGPLGLSIIPSSDILNSSVMPFPESHLHPLSNICLARTRRKISSALEVLKNSALAPQSWEEDQPSRILRVKRDVVIRTRAVRESKAALADCRRLAITADPFASRAALAVQRLRAVAEETGATIMEEGNTVDGNDVILTVCGTKFLADFNFFDVSGSVVQVKVKFRYITANVEEVGDAAVDASFAEYLQKEDFDALRKAFTSLIQLDKLDAAVPGVSLIDALRCFEDDLLDAQSMERKANLLDHERISRGHGVINRTAQGLKIDFIKGHSAILGLEDAIPSREISIGRSQLISRASHAINPAMPLFELTNTKTATVDAQYVLRFHEPISMCLTVAQNLERMQNREGAKKPARPTLMKASGYGKGVFTSRGDMRNEDSVAGEHSWPSLQELLAPRLFLGQKTGSDFHMSQDGQALERSIGKENVHWSQDATEYIAAAALPNNQYVQFSHSGSDVVSGLSVHRVPLCHPGDVMPILALVRQQIVFNDLFTSCFGSPIRVASDMISAVRQPVEVVLCDSPSFMQFSLFDDSMDDIVNMAVDIGLSGELSVTLKTSSGRHPSCSDAKVTAILRVCRSIPLTILTLVKMNSASAGRPTA